MIPYFLRVFSSRPTCIQFGDILTPWTTWVKLNKLNPNNWKFLKRTTRMCARLQKKKPDVGPSTTSRSSRFSELHQSLGCIKTGARDYFNTQYVLTSQPIATLKTFVFLYNVWLSLTLIPHVFRGSYLLLSRAPLTTSTPPPLGVRGEPDMFQHSNDVPNVMLWTSLCRISGPSVRHF